MQAEDRFDIPDCRPLARTDFVGKGRAKSGVGRANHLIEEINHGLFDFERLNNPSSCDLFKQIPL
jgi:hypothetical protein